MPPTLLVLTVSPALTSSIWAQHEQAVETAGNITGLIGDAETAIAEGLNQMEAG